MENNQVGLSTRGTLRIAAQKASISRCFFLLRKFPPPIRNFIILRRKKNRRLQNESRYLTVVTLVFAAIFFGYAGHTASAASASAVPLADLPQLGAEIWVTPDTTTVQLDHWMQLLAHFRMPYARLFMLQNQLPVGKHWKNSLVRVLVPYDKAFAAAARYGVKIAFTLPTSPIPQGSAAWTRQKDAVKFIVRRYRKNPALYAWLLTNEPHLYSQLLSGAPYNTPAIRARYRTWLKHEYGNIMSLNAEWGSRFTTFKNILPYPAKLGSYNHNQLPQASFNDWQAYWRYYLTHFLTTISAIIRQNDPTHQINVNPDNVMSNLAAQCQDIPAWRPAVTAMGCSVHPAWHFALLRRRNQYALGVAYICDEIRGFADPKSFWVTELQGGNNIYSGGKPLYPTHRDISQWTWTAIGSGAHRVIYWLLNTRPDGIESGEWSLLDFQNKPSSRLMSAGGIAKAIDSHRRFFYKAHQIASPVTIVLSMDAMTFQLAHGNPNAQIDEALGFYQAFSNLGMPVNFKMFHEYPWRNPATKGQLVILPHLAGLTRKQAADITAFEANGNTVVATGLTGFWNPRYQLQVLQHFPLKQALGGAFKEVRYEGSRFPITIHLNHSKMVLPARHFIGNINNSSGKVLASQDGRILATENHLGNGTAFWVPSLIGTAAWYGNHQPLAQFMDRVCATVVRNIPFRFAACQSHVILRTLQNGHRYLTVITNGAGSPIKCRLISPAGLKWRIMWGQADTIAKNGLISLEHHQTVVLLWR